MSMYDSIGVPILNVNRNSVDLIGNTCPMYIGQRVRLARKEKGLTQEELCAKVGIKQSTLSELERGDSVSTTHISSIAAALGVSALWLDSGKGRKHPSMPVGTGELDAGIELLTLYRQSSSEGRALILDTARLADKGED